MDFIKSKKTFLTCLLIFIFAITARVFWLNQRAGLHVDEMFTTVISNASDIGWRTSMPEKTFINGKDLQNLVYPNSTISEYKSDIKKLYQNNFYDNSHPNLYYMMFRTITLNAGKMDATKIANYGFCLNLAIFSLSFWIMFNLLKRLFGKASSLVPIGLLCAFLNTGTISATLFVRPYELQIFAFVLSSYIFVNFEQGDFDKKISFGKLAILGTEFALILLSGYLIVPYAAILASIILYKKVKNKSLLTIKNLLSSAILGTVLTFVIYPNYLAFFSSQRMSAVFGFFENLIFSTAFGIQNIVNFLLYLPILLIILLVLKNKKSLFAENTIAKSLFICAILWTFLSIFIAPFKILRYFMASLPILAIVIPLTFAKSEGQLKKIFAIFIGLYFVILPFFAVKTESSDTELVNRHALSNFIPHIENTFFNEKSNLKYLNNPKQNVAVIYTDSWQCFHIINFANPDQNYYFIKRHDRNTEPDILPQLPRPFTLVIAHQYTNGDSYLVKRFKHKYRVGIFKIFEIK